MAFNPGRSWAKIYTQGWNLCMRDPVPKNTFNHGGSNGKFAGARVSEATHMKQRQVGSRGRKADYLLGFQRIKWVPE